jgi:hypothetical protein
VGRLRREWPSQQWLRLSVCQQQPPGVLESLLPAALEPVLHTEPHLLGAEV